MYSICFLGATLTPCQREHIKYGDRFFYPGRYSPTCKPDGRYEEVQCHPSIGTCWCVDANGQEIPGTKKWGQVICTAPSRSYWYDFNFNHAHYFCFRLVQRIVEVMNAGQSNRYFMNWGKIEKNWFFFSLFIFILWKNQTEKCLGHE